MKQEHKGNLMLLLAAVIWGAAFVAQSEGMKFVEPFTMQATRFFLAALVLIPVIALRDKSGTTEYIPHSPADYKRLLLGGAASGVFLFTASSLQQVGLLYTSVGKSGFITALYVVLVPLLGLFAGNKLPLRVWIGVVLAVAGLYFLCVRDAGALNKGDLLTMACMVFFSLQILVVDRFAKGVDGVRFSFVQFLVTALLATVFMFATETPTMDAILQCWLPICYAGILSGGAGYTLQILGQRHTKPAIASLLMSLESVFAVLFGWILIGQKLAPLELLGCILMFAAIILAQLPGKKKEA